MYKALAEAWFWEPDKINALTPDQLIHLSGSAPPAAGGKITLNSMEELKYWRQRWNEVHSEENRLRRAEKALADELARN